MCLILTIIYLCRHTHFQIHSTYINTYTSIPTHSLYKRKWSKCYKNYSLFILHQNTLKYLHLTHLEKWVFVISARCTCQLFFSPLSLMYVNIYQCIKIWVREWEIWKATFSFFFFFLFKTLLTHPMVRWLRELKERIHEMVALRWTLCKRLRSSDQEQTKLHKAFSGQNHRQEQ